MDLRDARVLAEAGGHPNACFHAQQSAEKSLKAALIALGKQGWGHSVDHLLEALSDYVSLPQEVSRAAYLDRYYIPTRYPNGLPGGVAGNVFNSEDSAAATASAEVVLQFAAECVGRAGEHAGS